MTEEEPRGRIPRLAIDLAMLVLGILIALSADSWWAGRQDAVEVSAILEALQTELDQNRRHFSARLASHDQMAAQSLELTRVINGAVATPTEATLSALIFSTLGATSVAPSFGAYDVLLSRGRTEGVPADFLVQLARHVNASRLGGSPTDTEILLQNQATITEVIRGHGGILSLMSSSSLIGMDLPESTRQPDARAILEDPRFADAATVVAILHRNRRAWLANRLAETESLLAALNQ